MHAKHIFQSASKQAERAEPGDDVPGRAYTRWKIAVNCLAVALCMLAGALLPSGAVANATVEAVEFVRAYGSVVVAAMAIMTLVLVDMVAWPLMTRATRR